MSPTRIGPPTPPLTAPFWDATRERRLLLQWCLDCDEPVFYPRARCPRCLGERLEWRESQGTGVVHAVTVEHRAQQPGLADLVPYAVALVELDEGVRLLTNVVGVDAVTVAVGQRVAVTWEPLEDGRNLPLFTPVGAP